MASSGGPGEIAATRVTHIGGVTESLVASTKHGEFLVSLGGKGRVHLDVIEINLCDADESSRVKEPM